MATKYHKQVRFPLLMSQETFDHLQQLAKASDVSISSYIRAQLQQHLDSTAN